MMNLRLAEERGHANLGWLDTYHTFSFADYYDPDYMGFRSLRVINEDRVSPGRGFGTHPHRDMEILTYVLEGALEHKDSMGTGSIISPGDVQRMSAGTGVTHSEANSSQSEPVHLLQIWLLPDAKNIAPSYEQKAFPRAEKEGRLRLVASPDAKDGSVTIHTDARLYVGIFASGERAVHTLAHGRYAWVQVARGRVRVQGRELEAGDGVALSQEPTLTIEGIDAGEVLVFDLA